MLEKRSSAWLRLLAIFRAVFGGIAHDRLRLPAYGGSLFEVKGLTRTAKFLHQQFIYDGKFLPYGSQLVPLVAILGAVDIDWETEGNRRKLERWFWCGVFGELYGGTTETRFSRDLPELLAWLDGASELPRTITEAMFSVDRLLTLRTRISAAYKGVYAMLMREGAEDWRTGTGNNIAHYFDEAVDIHHVFPRAWCDKQGIPASPYDSVVNKTPLSARTNRMIGGNAPSVYLPRVVKDAGIEPTTCGDTSRATSWTTTCLRRTTSRSSSRTGNSACSRRLRRQWARRRRQPWSRPRRRLTRIRRRRMRRGRRRSPWWLTGHGATPPRSSRRRRLP